MLSKMALGSIWAYQTYVSPNKGFRCAYAVRHGGTGCSGYAKYAIRDHGLWRALPVIRQRLRDCRAAHQQLRENCVCSEAPLDKDERAELERRRRDARWYNKCDCGAGCCECGSAAPAGCFRSSGSVGARKSLDLNPCDGDGCGLDCGGADCASCDCGGCSCS